MRLLPHVRFTPEEVRRLTALQRRMSLQPVHVDLELDLRRLELALACRTRSLRRRRVTWRHETPYGMKTRH